MVYTIRLHGLFNTRSHTRYRTHFEQSKKRRPLATPLRETAGGRASGVDPLLFRAALFLVLPMATPPCSRPKPGVRPC